MSFSFSVSSNAPFTLSTSLNAHSHTHSQHPPSLLSLQSHPLPPSTLSASTPSLPSVHGLDVASYHSLIHAELLYLQQQQDSNARMQRLLQQQMQLAQLNHSASPLQPRLSPPLPPPFAHPMPASSPGGLMPSTQTLPPAMLRPPYIPAAPLSASSPPRAHSAFAPQLDRSSPMPSAAQRSSNQHFPYSHPLANALTLANASSSAFPAVMGAPVAPAHMHSPSPPSPFHPYAQHSLPQPLAPPGPVHPAVHHAHTASSAEPYPYQLSRYSHAHPAAPFHFDATSHPPSHPHSQSRSHTHQPSPLPHPHMHSAAHTHSHVHPYSRPVPSYVSGQRGLLLPPHAVFGFQPLFPHFSLPVHVHMSAPEDNKRAASAAAVHSLQRQLVERRLRPEAATDVAGKTTTAESQEDVATCAVCLCDFAHGELSVLMPCAHPYHEACLLPWLAKHNTCPSCRYELLTDDEQYNRAVRIKQDRQRLEKERRTQRQSHSGGLAFSAEGVGAEERAEAEAEGADAEEDTMYDDSELDDDEDEDEEREREDGEAEGSDEDEDDESGGDYDDEEDDSLALDADGDSDVVEIAPPHSAAHSRANPIVIDTDDEDDYKHSHDLSLASYPSIPSLPSTATTLSAWSAHSADALPLAPVVPLGPAVSCALCGEACAVRVGQVYGGGGGVLSTACCGVVCHTACVQRMGFGDWITASGQLTCPTCRAPAAST